MHIKIYLLTSIFICKLLSAQEAVNLKIVQKEKKIYINYDLIGNYDYLEVRLFISKNDGKKWEGPLKYVSGDIGEKISTGRNKIVVWDVLAEREKFQGDWIFGFELIPSDNFISGNTEINKFQILDKYKSASIALECLAFYNLENLFDTIVDPDTNKILQEDFTPHGPKNFNSQRYYHKLHNMAYVISKLGKEITPHGPSVIGVCEIENRQVLEDLVRQESIANKKYKIVQHEGPDKRGIDCALLYDPLHFQLTASKSVRLTIPNSDDFFTRDQLVVSGNMLGEKIHFIVIHWPSRRGGEEKSRPKRIEAAKLSKSLIDSLQLVDPNAKVILMGDFNDDPISPSIKDVLKAKGEMINVKDGELFNTMGEHYKKGIGTLAYRDQWNLFDQFIVTSSLLDKKKVYDDLTFYRSIIFNKPFLKNKKGNFKGYPFRTYVGSTFMGGYSDHFPVYLFLVKKV